ncbi:MAG: hypothetical protein ABR568_09270 [Pyrinomonadaceae bacterium]
MIPARIAGRRNAVRDEQPQRGGPRFRSVRVHFDEAGKEELTGAFDNTRAGGNHNPRRRTDYDDTFVANQDCCVCDRLSAGGWNDRHVSNGKHAACLV